MMQLKEIGKKRDWAGAREGRTFVSPQGRQYSYDRGSRGITVLVYFGQRMQVKNADFKNTPVDVLLQAMEAETKNNQ